MASVDRTIRTLRVIVVGSDGGSHIGGSLMRACGDLGLVARFCDVDRAWRLGTTLQKVFWHGLGRRPVHLRQFSRAVLRECVSFQPDCLITTGPSPLTRKVLAECRARGIRCVNFSTDDPFNRDMRMRWYLEALPEYDVVFTPRRSNIDELRVHGCRQVEYLPFGYDPHLFYNPGSAASEETSDLFFAGTGDAGRLPYVAEAVEARLDVRLHGNYWDQYRETKAVARGQADLATLRAGLATCRVALCLVRHENRDGHSMRTFEVPAVGACMVVEDTAEHREIFGSDGARVVYFRSPSEMVARTNELLADAATRCRLRDSAHIHITQGRNTYADRLRVMLGHV